MQLFVDQLTNVDFSYLCPTRGVVGETWLADVRLNGALDAQGMVCDFGIVKGETRRWLDTTIDHCLLVPTRNPAISVESTRENHKVYCELADGGTVVCESPTEAITLIDATEISTLAVAQWSLTQLRGLFPNSVETLQLIFNEEAINGPYYHYSHGLKKHKGNCQRIAHGHRSKLEIYRNGLLAESDMQTWANNWRDIYIATREDLVDGGDAQQLEFAYNSQQGGFYISLPKRLCYLIDTDSTVEFIAQHIATTIKAIYPNDRITVKAYEGLAKGAICEV